MTTLLIILLMALSIVAWINNYTYMQIIDRLEGEIKELKQKKILQSAKGKINKK